jgi:hypothetical protein
VVHLNAFSYPDFEGVDKEKIRSYVNYNTVRHAFEAGEFTVQWPGDGWRVKRNGR